MWRQKGHNPRESGTSTEESGCLCVLSESTSCSNLQVLPSHKKNGLGP